ncbi:hypothetical protein KQI58_00515 [Enterococcus raffinosus]|uniref:hypothetical protein n=1 Tax=Enterococcus raffinosus TaxID=71452 RepID=UPI001C10DAD4|nr:hypothetical protein [Enterococcus raffinosus]MBU5359554.1 hypothetical protein [Enterococcus raffinosus]
MENWKDTFINQVPKDVYTVKINSGEQDGLNIMLYGEKNRHKIEIDFGALASYRIIDEGFLLSECELVIPDKIVKKLKKDNYPSTLYEIENESYSKFINEISCGLFDIYEMKQYNIITLNYVIEIASRFDPIINILN